MCPWQLVEGIGETGEIAKGLYLVRHQRDGIAGLGLGLSLSEVALVSLGRAGASIAIFPYHNGGRIVVELGVEVEVDPFRRHMEHNSLGVVQPGAGNLKCREKRTVHLLDVALSHLCCWMSADLALPLVVVAVVVAVGSVVVVLDQHWLVFVDPGHASPTASEGKNISDYGLRHSPYPSVTDGSCLDIIN